MGNCPCKDGAKPTETTEQVGEEAATSGAAASLHLMVAVAGVRGLRGASWQPGADKPGCFCTVKAPSKDEELCKTDGVKGAFEPAWKQEFEIAEHSAGDSLQFSIWEEDKLLGTATLEASTFASAGFNGELKLEQNDEGIEAYLTVKVGVNGQEYPKGASAEYLITVNREENKPLGLDIDSQDGVTCFVDGIRPGPFQAHNDNSKTSEQLRRGDFIVKVDEVEGDAKKLLKKMTSAATFTVLVRRSEEFGVAVERASTRKPLGLEFSKPLANALIVSKVVPKGPFQAWNGENPEREVRKGDRVVAVCGKRGKAADLQKQLSTLKQIEVTVLRPASLDSWRFW